MKSVSEPNSLFGGMAASSWNSSPDRNWRSDPINEQSWLFKIEKLNTN